MVTYKGSLFQDEEQQNKQQHSFHTKTKDGVATIQLICEVEEDHLGLCYWFDYTDKIVYSGKRVVE